MENITENIRKYLDFKGISINKFSQEIGVSNSYFNKQFKENGSVGSKIIQEIVKIYEDINPTWLLTGKGEMLRNSPPLEVAKNAPKGYPLLPIEAIGGIGTEIDVQIQNSDISTHYVVPEFDRIKPDFLIKVKGSSMVPKYNSGDIIAIKKITDKSIIQWNRPYVLDTDENGVMVKRINQIQNPDVWSLHSDNAKYPPFNMPLKNVRSIFLVVGVIRSE